MRIRRPSDDELVVCTSVRERVYGAVCVFAGFACGCLTWLTLGGISWQWLDWPIVTVPVISVSFALIGAYLMTFTRQTTFRRDSAICTRSLGFLSWRLRVREVLFDEVGIVRNEQGPDAAVMLYRRAQRGARLWHRIAARLFATQVADFGSRRPAAALTREIAQLTGAAAKLD